MCLLCGSLGWQRAVLAGLTPGPSQIPRQRPTIGLIPCESIQQGPKTSSVPINSNDAWENLSLDFHNNSGPIDEIGLSITFIDSHLSFHLLLVTLPLYASFIYLTAPDPNQVPLPTLQLTGRLTPTSQGESRIGIKIEGPSSSITAQVPTIFFASR